MIHIGQRIAASIFLALTSAVASATVVSTNDEYGFIDGNELSRILHVSTHGTIKDLNILVEFSKCDDPSIGPSGGKCLGWGNPYENEFSLVLSSPNGDRAELVRPWSTYNGARFGSGRIEVTFDDQATEMPGPNIKTGTYRPAEMISAFNGMDMFGSWTLYLQDFGAGDPLEFYSAQIDITYESKAPNQVPEPGTMALMGLGLFSIASLSKKKESQG